MKPVHLRRLAALALGSLLALGLGWAWWLRHAAAQRAEYEAQARRIRKLVAEHARESPAPAAPTPSASTRTPESRPFYLAPDVAAQLFPRDRSSEIYDPWSYYHHKPSLTLSVPWPEHPDGKWSWTTNSLGLREDRELSTTQPDVRILVTGDSHTDGFCNNAESFPHVAERLLARDLPGRSIEVINAGNGGFSFHNYLGVLERFLDAKPDAFVVAVYPGNDFKELLAPNAWFEHVPLVEPTQEQADLLARLGEISSPASVQFFHSLAWFHLHPEEVETSVAAALGLLERMRAICDEHKIRFLCVMLPSAIDLPWGQNAELFERMRAASSMSREDLRGNERMAEELLARLRAKGCDTLDARESLRAVEGPCHWIKDLHLNVRGHTALAQALAQKLESFGGRFAR